MSPTATPLTVLENQAGYQALQQRLEQLHRQPPQAHSHVRIDAAGQYAANLEHPLRTLPLPLTLSIGEPNRNKDYPEAHFPKRTTDDTESQAMARLAVVELPQATLPVPPQFALPAAEVVTTAPATVEPALPPVSPPAPARPPVDFAFVREQSTMGRVRRHLGRFEGLRGRAPQLRGCCPVHGQAGTKERTFSVHLGKNVFQCFPAQCGPKGNVLGLWAVVRGLPLYEAAVPRTQTFGLRRHREEEPAAGTR